MGFVAIDELTYLRNIADTLVTNGWYNRAFTGLSKNMQGQRIIAVRHVEHSNPGETVPALAEFTFEVIIGVAQPVGGADAIIGTASEPGALYLAGKTQETYELNLTNNCYNYTIGDVVSEQFAQHPQNVVRFPITIRKGINPQDRDRGGVTGNIVVPALQAQNLTDLGDVTVSGPASGEVIKYNGSEWVNDTDSTGTTIDELNDIGDVSAASPSNHSILKYDGSDWTPTDNVTVEDASSGVPFNVPMLSADPVTPANGDLWIVNDGGTVKLKYAREDNGQVLSVTLSP